MPTNTPIPTSTPVPGTNFALAFDGVNDDLRGIAIAGLNGTQTVEFWLRPNVAGQNGVILATTDDASGWSLELDGGRITWWIYTAAGQWQGLTHPVALTAGTWSHVAATYNAGVAQIFVNGTGGTATTVGTITAGPRLRVGGLAPYGFVNAQLDELRFSNNVRYAANFGVPTAPFAPDANTLALFNFNEGAGQTVADAQSPYTLTLGATANAENDDPTWVTSTVPFN
ncbi:MAG: LamG domain-containing protein [Chloroflexia bacterium]|nr:LamG domain-containing protein [Chloroflexia bacterium]